jgi:hypothetical protein
MSMKSKIFPVVRPGSPADIRKQELLQRHRAEIDSVLGKAKSLSKDSQRTLKEIRENASRDSVKR